MRGFLINLLERSVTAAGRTLAPARPRRLPPPQPEAGPPRDAVRAVERQLRAQALAEAIERAVDLGHREHAAQIAQTASRLADDSPRLREALARLRLAQGDPESALTLIDDIADSSAPLRLLHDVCLLMLGGRDGAHRDLSRWSRQPLAPAQVRLLLAHEEWEAGDEHAAMLALYRTLRHRDDPDTLELLALLAAARGRADQASVWTDRLERATAFLAGPSRAALLRSSLGLSPSPRRIRATAARVQRLADDLCDAEPVLPALVAAQRIDPRPELLDLLSRAVEHALDRLTDQVAAHEALARLAMLAGRETSALIWVDRGLELAPMSATLAMMAEELRVTDGPADAAEDDGVIGRIGGEEYEAGRDGDRPQRGKAA